MVVAFRLPKSCFAFTFNESNYDLIFNCHSQRMVNSYPLNLATLAAYNRNERDYYQEYGNTSFHDREMITYVSFLII